jgi:hypothetical protein
MMAASLLRGLGAKGLVSTVAIDAKEKLSEAKGCDVAAFTTSAAGLAFDRTDERLPFPIPEGARNVLSFDPTILELSQYLLTVKNLAEGPYTLKINNVAVGSFDDQQLAAGINLTELDRAGGTNPIAAQGAAILNAVAAKEGIVGRWRGLSKQAHAAGANADLKSQLAALTTEVEQADEAIRAAAKPKKLHFEVVKKP